MKGALQLGQGGGANNTHPGVTTTDFDDSFRTALHIGSLPLPPSSQAMSTQGFRQRPAEHPLVLASFLWGKGR